MSVEKVIKNTNHIKLIIPIMKKHFNPMLLRFHNFVLEYIFYMM